MTPVVDDDGVLGVSMDGERLATKEGWTESTEGRKTRSLVLASSPHSLPDRWLAILMCYWADSSSSGWVISPSPFSAGHESQLPFENSPPIMQTDTGMLFKNPQPICWSLLIYKGLRAESPVKTILDTIYTGSFGLWKRGGGGSPPKATSNHHFLLRIKCTVEH